MRNEYPVEWLNEKPYEHLSRFGTEFKAERCDFKTGLKVEIRKGQSWERIISDIMEMTAQHAIQVHPHLNGFQGYDCVDIEFKVRKP